MQSDPSGIGNDRAEVKRIEEGEAVLAVGPSLTPMHVPTEDLPEGAEVGTWLILDLQLHPPMVLGIDRGMTDSR